MRLVYISAVKLALMKMFYDEMYFGFSLTAQIT